MNSLRNMFRLSLAVAVAVLLISVAFFAGYKAGSDVEGQVSIGNSSTQVDPTATLPPLTPTASQEISTDTPQAEATESPSPSPEPQATSTPETETTEETTEESSPAPTEDQPGQETDLEGTLTEEEALQVLQEVWGLVDTEFYGELPPPEERVYGAIRGMLDTLDDDYTSFLEPSIAEIERTDASGSFEGIGALVRMNDQDILEIVRPFEGQPAAEAGLLPGDLVLKVDDESIVGYGIYEAITLIRGPKGTKVTLTVQRGLDTEPFEVIIVRASIDIPIVENRMLEGNIGYVSLFDFSSQAETQLKEAIEELRNQGATSLIFDLRTNPGGYLDQAVRVADLFLDEGMVLIERASGGYEREFTSTNEGLAQDIPLVVLVNGGSASASEIVAGALQDRGRAILIGETTFGKGSVQLPHTLSDGSELRVTIARWFTPNDRAIHGEGLAPDIEVPFTPEDLEAERDPQLDRAIEYIKTGQ